MQTIALVQHEQVKQRVNELHFRSDEYKSKLGPTLKRLWNPNRQLFQVDNLAGVNTLYDKFPHFASAIDIYQAHIKVGKKLRRPFVAKPILLLGSPGIGKTYFASELAKTLELPYYEIAMNTISAGFAIAGGNLQWGDADVGYIAKFLADSSYANPLILLDEIDKATATGGRFDPMAPMYSLLENHSAKRFRDEALELNIDASHINWIATANYSGLIPEPILSRLNVIELGEIKESHMISIIQSIYSKILIEQDYHKLLYPELKDTVINQMIGMSPRNVGLLLSNAAIRAINQDRDCISSDDITNIKPVKEIRRVGFI